MGRGEGVIMGDWNAVEAPRRLTLTFGALHKNVMEESIKRWSVVEHMAVWCGIMRW